MLLALCAAASPASASQPGLRVAHGIHGWFLDSDGEAQLAYGVSPYPSVVVQNAITGSRRLFRGKPCPDSEVYLRPVLVAGGRFLQHCGARWIVTDLRSGAAASVAIPAAIMPNPFVTGLGRVWIEDEVSASPFQPPFVTLFDPTTGDLRQRPQLSATTYLDLDALPAVVRSRPAPRADRSQHAGRPAGQGGTAVRSCRRGLGLMGALHGRRGRRQRAARLAMRGTTGPDHQPRSVLGPARGRRRDVAGAGRPSPIYGGSLRGAARHRKTLALAQPVRLREGLPHAQRPLRLRRLPGSLQGAR
jgi:hypothetical protein